VTAKLDFSGDGVLAVDGNDVGSGVISVIEGDGETFDDEPEPEPEPEPVPEVPDVPEPALVPVVDPAGSTDVVGATAELVYEAPLAE
jgi:hypothetical protein